MKVAHITDPGRSHGGAPRVHLQSLDGQTLMCGHGYVYREIDGEKFRIWHVTKRPVNCQSCTKALEALVRLQLNGLDSGQLEDILAHIESFRVPGDAPED